MGCGLAAPEQECEIARIVRVAVACPLKTSPDLERESKDSGP